MSTGRPRSLDEVKQGEICALVASGVSLRAAALYVGCDRSTIRREERRNEQFAENLRRSEMQAEYFPLQKMHDACHTHWRAAAWMLERTRPEQYARVAANLVKLETVHDLVERLVEVIAEELAEIPEGKAVCRRLHRAIQDTCGELTVAAVANRNPKRLRKIIDRMSTQPKTDEGEDDKVELLCAADFLPAGQTEQHASTEQLQEV
jgi:IS30 family transposase